MFENYYSIILLYMFQKPSWSCICDKESCVPCICASVFIYFFQDICVDKARLEECEERASELSRKVSNSQVMWP